MNSDRKIEKAEEMLLSLETVFNEVRETISILIDLLEETSSKSKIQEARDTLKIQTSIQEYVRKFKKRLKGSSKELASEVVFITFPLHKQPLSNLILETKVVVERISLGRYSRVRSKILESLEDSYHRLEDI